MANKTRSTRSYFSHNLGLKFISLIFAFLLWSFVTNSTNPERTKNISDVKIEIQGEEILAEKGFSIRDDLSKLAPVDIKVKVSHSDYSSVNAEVVHAYIDVSEISTDGTHHVTIKPSFSNFVNASFVSVEPQQSITLTIDKIIEKEVKVVLKETGALKDGLVKFAPQYDKTIMVKGSGFYLERIEKAMVEVDLSTLSDGDDVRIITCKFLDKDDNVLNVPGQSIEVDMDIQSVMEYSLNISDAIINSDKVADGFEFIGASTGKIYLCAHKDHHVNANDITVQQIDLTGKDDSFTSAPIILNLPEGISLKPGQEAPQAAIKIVQQSDTITISRPLTVSGLNKDLTATIKYGDKTVHILADGTTNLNIPVKLSGVKAAIDSIKETDIVVRLSLKEKESGEYELIPVIFSSDSVPSAVKVELASPTKLMVELNKSVTKETLCNVIVDDVPANHTASITLGNQSIQVTKSGATSLSTTVLLTGPEFVIDGLKSDDLVVRVSLKGLGAGTYEIAPITSLKSEISETLKAELKSSSKVSVIITSNEG